MWKPPECTVSGGFFLLVGWFALCCGRQTALTVLGAAALNGDYIWDMILIPVSSLILS